MTETEFRLTVNGAERSVACEPDTPLLEVLRLELDLAGPKFGCGMGLCGACFVLIEGRARASCDLAVSAVGGPVTTVEGLLDGGRLHPVQQAFIDEQAAQCGYCTDGMVMATAGLLRDCPAPAEREVREALDGNLCRCGTHGRIIRAVQKAAGRMSGGRAAISSPPAAEVLVSQVPAAGTPTGAGPVLAPPSGSPSPLVAESGVPSGVSPLRPDLAGGHPMPPAADLRRPTGWAPRATRCPATTSPASRSPGTGCWTCRSGPPRCGRSARTSTCTRSSRSWTNWPPRPRRPGAIPARPPHRPAGPQVLTQAADMAGWDTRGRRDGTGYGIGVARYSGVAGYCAAVAEVEAGTDIRVRRVWLAVDVGRVINPDGVINQVEGGAVQSASWTLREQVRFDRYQITSAGWDSYPILRFTETPEVRVRVMDAPGEAEVGAGEVAQGPVAGAIGNAVANAVGVRVRDLPLTRERITRAIQEN